MVAAAFETFGPMRVKEYDVNAHAVGIHTIDRSTTMHTMSGVNNIFLISFSPASFPHHCCQQSLLDIYFSRCSDRT